MKLKSILIAFFACLQLGALAQTEKTYLFIGSYTNGEPGKGIYIYEFNSTTGKLKKVCTGSGLINPSFLCLSSSGNSLYACTESKLPSDGNISAFAFDSKSGKLSFLNKQNSGGENPVYVTTSLDNRFVVAGNYTSATVSVFKTNADGSLDSAIQVIEFHGNGPVEGRQEKAHIHAAVFSPDQAFLFLPDLGSDKIHTIKFNQDQSQHLELKQEFDFIAQPGSGPRHLTFHPNNRFAYCIEELSGTVSAFTYENGKLNSIQRVFSYSKKQEVYNSADIHISPDGRFLYASNRWDNENTISIFSIDDLTGRLELVGHQTTYGDHPRNFTLDPTGNFLIVANQVTNNIVVFKRNAQTGLLLKTKYELNIPNPSCVIMRTYSN